MLQLLTYFADTKSGILYNWNYVKTQFAIPSFVLRQATTTLI